MKNTLGCLNNSITCLLAKRLIGRAFPAFALGLLAICSASGLRADNTTAVTGTVVASAAGDYHSLFLTSDGNLWAMGNNAFGQLGDGTTTDRDTPVLVATNVAAVAAGSYHSLFITDDGNLWAMGYNISSQSDGGGNGSNSGNGDAPYQAAPVQVASGVTSVSAGAFHSLYVTEDGTLWAMGDNSDGQLGRKDVGLESAEPVVVAEAIGDGAPVYTMQPTDQRVTINAGQTVNATFAVSATGTPTPSFQWQERNAKIDLWSNVSGLFYSGYTTGTLSITNAPFMSDKQYRCVATNIVGSATSNSATLVVTLDTSNNSGGGGGGAPSLWFLGVLGALVVWRVRKRG